MARRKITAISNEGKTATVYKDPEWGEFIVRLKGRPQADYFTSDREDAEATARRMVFGRIDVTRNFVRRRQRSPRSCAPGSFRTVKQGPHRIVICCPKGKWNRKTKRCRVGTRAQSILHRKGK